MEIEYKDIVINSENLSQYRNGNLLCGRAHHTINEAGELSGDQKIIVFNYSIDPKLNLSQNDKLRKIIKFVNAEQYKTAAHERHHIHNHKYLPMNVAYGNYYTYVLLCVLDEISARFAEELHGTLNTRWKRFANLDMIVIGRPSFVITRFATCKFNRVFNEYCDKFLDGYWRQINFLGRTQATECIIAPQIELYKYDLKDIKPVVYTKDFYQAVEHYFTFGQITKRPLKCSRSQINELISIYEDVIFDAVKTRMKKYSK